MSKSKKTEKVNAESLLKDTDRLFKFIDKFEALDLEKANLNRLQKEINTLRENFKNKYKEYIPAEDLEKFEGDLDTEK